MSPSSTALSSTEIVLEFSFLTFSSSAATSSSVTSTLSFSTARPLYCPNSTAGFNATSAVKMKDCPASACVTSILGCETISKSSAAVTSLLYTSGIRSLIASSKKIWAPYIFSSILRGTLPFLKPGTLILFLFFWYDFSTAFSNSSAGASIVSLAIFFSNFSTCKLILYFPP